MPLPQIEPTHLATLLLEQAMALHQAGSLQQAREKYQSVLDIHYSAMAEHYIGVLDMQDKQLVRAEKRIRAALKHLRDVPDFYNNLGLCLRAQYRHAEAIVEYQKAIAIDPTYAPAWSNLALSFHKNAQFSAALEASERAIELDPGLVQARFNKALTLLTLGDYSNGWFEYEARTSCPEVFPDARLPPRVGEADMWEGQSLRGKKILLIAEQGLGDSFQFIRYAENLATEAVQVSLYVGQAFTVETLLRGVRGISAVYTDDSVIPPHDYVCRLLSLPYLCRTNSLQVIPANVPYMAVSSERCAYWRNRLSDLRASICIGVAWAGNPSQIDDHSRSCQLQELKLLFGIPDLVWVSLQHGAGREQLVDSSISIVDWSEDMKDYAETAALISELDLIITVDTSVAHAAGALGRPVWLMLSYIADFRWLRDRGDSPWYPTARLFRQKHDGDWAGVVREMQIALNDLNNAKHRIPS